MAEMCDEILHEHRTQELYRVLHVVPNLDVGGAARGVIEIATELNRRGRFDPTICVFGEPPRERFMESGALRVAYLHRPTSRRRSFIGRLLALDSVIQEIGPHLVHAHLWPAAAAAAQLARFRKFPLVVHIRDTPERFAQTDLWSSVRRRWYQWLFAEARFTFVAVSQSAADYTAQKLRISKERIHVVMNGVDGGPFACEAVKRTSMPIMGNRRIVVGAVGRFVVEKGHMYLLEAVNRLVCRGVDVCLTLVGSGGLLEKYMSFVAAHGLQDRVEIRGPTDRMAEFYGSIDVFVLPTASSEGLSRAVLEAMACGLPVISTDCPSSVEVIRDGENGLIVKRQSVEALEVAIETLYRNSQLCAELSRRARERYLKHHTIDAVVDQIEQLYLRKLAPSNEGRS